jgi:hypothetical protein
MDEARSVELISEVADRQDMTSWEVWQMVKLVVFGPEAVDNPVFDPIEELELRASRDLKRLAGAERPSIPELLSIWQHAHDVCVALAERQRDPAKRALWFAQLADREREMKQLREWIAQVQPKALRTTNSVGDGMSEEGRLRMQCFRAFVEHEREEREKH